MRPLSYLRLNNNLLFQILHLFPGPTQLGVHNVAILTHDCGIDIWCHTGCYSPPDNKFESPFNLENHFCKGGDFTTLSLVFDLPTSVSFLEFIDAYIHLFFLYV